MKQPSILRTLALFILLLCAASVFSQTAAPRRVALVIGNGAYQANALRNPPNDADDVAAALKESGFEVSLVKDASLEAMEKAVNEFAARLTGADTGLFYYAGHGVAIDGLNWLIPVSPRIDDAASVKSRAIAVDTVVGTMETTGVRTTLVFLDSCRDNPFPGASRSGSRGLAVVAAPKTVNSLIAYATSPGDVAQDGSGRNGVFSGALIKQLREPRLELTIMMRNVKAEVAAATASKQNPRVDDGMKEPFCFVSLEDLASRADATLAKSKAELAELERQIADRQARMQATKDTVALQSLQVEQQRQQALQAAKKLEAENLAREAERQRKAALASEQLASQKSAAQQATQQQQGALADLAVARRAELDTLALSGASDNPDVLIETVERLEVVLKEVDGQYAAALQKSLAATNDTWDKQLVSMSGQVPDITESDAEFAARLSREKTDLESKRQAELATLRTGAEAQRLGQTASIRRQYEDTLKTLETKVWTIRGSAVSLSIGNFDRNAKTWPFTVDSRDPGIPMLPVNLVAELGKAADPTAAIRSLDTAVKANALSGEIDWGITRDTVNKRYAIDVQAARVRNLTGNEVVVEARPNQRAAYFVAGKRTSPQKEYKIGDTGPAGGIMFHDKGSVSDGWRYMEAAPSDQSAGIQWYNGSNIGINTGTAVGTGKANTEAIIAKQGTGNYAASLCKNLSINGFSDWFLPSKDELNLMYANLKKKGLGGLGEGWFWSSSQASNYDTWKQRFSDGYQVNTSKYVKYSVRAVRVF